MQRLRLSIVTGLLSCFALAACSENPNDVKLLNGSRGTVVTSTQSLDQSIRALLARFPKSLDQRDPDSEGPDLNPRATWDQITKKYATGLSKPAHMVIAKRKLVRLSDWATRNAQMMVTPPGDPEPKASAAARLVLYMNMYVYGGPGGTPPDFIPGADVAVGIVTPDAPATIVTPTKHAGVQFEAGSVDENTVVVVIQNPALYTAPCSGPLTTKLCQYPQFYTFDQFPHKALLKPAKFNVCHVNTGEARRPLADHDRLRLAHVKPANAADYTDGSTIRDGIEILPLVPQTFSTCEGSTYEPETEIGLGDAGLLSRFARGIRKMVSPKTAYAIDLGLGGLSKSFSAFNDVDPVGRPDLSVVRLFIVSGCGEVECVANPGGRVTFNYQVKNIGTATSAQVPYTIRLVSVPANPEDPGIPVQLTLFSGFVSALLPSGTQSNIQASVPIPGTVQPGAYNLQFVVGDDEAFSEDAGTLANNTASTPVTLGIAILNLGTLAGDTWSEGLAINDAGHAVGESHGSTNVYRPFIWMNGTMTALGNLGGINGWAQGINNDDVVVGWSQIATGEQRAFRWKDGVMTNLGTLPGRNWSVAVGVNSAGQVAGTSVNCATQGVAIASCTGATIAHAFVWQNGVMTDLGLLPGGTSTEATAINDAGQVVGYGDSEGGIRSWIWQNGSMTVLSGLGGFSSAYGLNNSGVVVGFTDVPASEELHAFRWSNGTITDIGHLPGDQYGLAEGISADGRIVGLSYGPNVFHAFLWQGSSMISLGSLGGDWSQANGINASGQIVGQSFVPGPRSTASRAVIWQAPPLQ